MDNSGREGLLLEVVKNFTGITYPEYADDKVIKKKIYNYLKLLQDFNQNKKDFSMKDYQELNKLHRFFYGISFNPEDPSANTFKTPIYDKFKSVFEKIENSINETNDINAELLKSLLSLITIYYDLHKNKDEIINEYLDKIIIPLLNSYKGIGVASDLKMSIKEEKPTEVVKEKTQADEKEIVKQKRDVVKEDNRIDIPNLVNTAAVIDKEAEKKLKAEKEKKMKKKKKKR